MNMHVFFLLLLLLGMCSSSGAGDTCAIDTAMSYSFSFCPNAFCLAGSYSFAFGNVGSFSGAENLTGCLSDCESDAGCSVATWCPLCASPRCFLFTSCNVWERTAVVLDPQLGINDICEVPEDDRQIAIFQDRGCERRSQAAITYMRQGSEMLPAGQRDCLCHPYVPPDHAVVTPQGSLRFGQEVLVECEDGFYAEEESRPQCLGDVGMFELNHRYTRGVQSCLACPVDSSSKRGSVKLASCSCNGGYFKDPSFPSPSSLLENSSSSLNSSNSTSYCRLCPGGKYREPFTDELCLPCPAGSYLPISGASNASLCLPCPPGSTSLAGSSLLLHCICAAGFSGFPPLNCSACGFGNFSGSEGSEECELCPAGYFSDAPPATSCRSCPAGTYSSAAASSSCSSCPPDSSSYLGASSPSDCFCLAGFERGESGNCVPCRNGTFKDSAGNSSCLPCPDNSTSRTGSRSISMCICRAGHVGSDGAVCVPCPGGSYKREEGDFPCLPCSPASFSSAGSSSCSSCPDNSTSARGQAACVCVAGYEPVPSSSPLLPSCSLCPEGRYKPTAGNVACSSCQGNSTSPAGSRAPYNCSCFPGFTRELVVPWLTCGGGCACSPSIGLHAGTISDGEGDYPLRTECWWLIAGRNIQVKLEEVDVEEGFDFLRLSSCSDPSCNQSLPIASFTGNSGANKTFFLAAGVMRVSLLSDFGISAAGFVATWRTDSEGYYCNLA